MQHVASSSPFEHILVAVDGASTPEATVEPALALVEGDPAAKLTFCHVLNVPRMVARAEQSIDDYGLAFRVARDGARSMLARCCRLAEQRGVNAQKCVRYGKPATELALLARLILADVIMIGNRPVGTMARVFWGSTRDQLLRESTVPVLIGPAAKALRGLVQGHVLEDQPDRADDERRDDKVNQHR
jgi:nucleotide-binding universal stress UspA family protein